MVEGQRWGYFYSYSTELLGNLLLLDKKELNNHLSLTIHKKRLPLHRSSTEDLYWRWSFTSSP